MFPELSALYNEISQNMQSARIRFRDPVSQGSIVKVLPGVSQRFIKIDASLTEVDDERFKYFTTVVLPRFRKKSTVSPDSIIPKQHLLVFIPSYLDLVRLRNYMDENEYDFEVISEYTNSVDKTRARTLFYQGRTPILLYTERSHFFYRNSIKGAMHIFFFAPPEYSVCYSELLNFLFLPKPESIIQGSAAEQEGATILYSKWDSLRLERILGTSYVPRLVTGDGPFVFRN
jgi:U3 small nucleolar RNA-associated protein 25